ncbi:MAG: LPPG:FO 2-phospho-L-lactate transferase [Halieaceae bacterium]|jgi:LPPG:FO 2-phospho-L-lactate transferase
MSDLAADSKVLAISGGVGGAKLALGLARELSANQLSFVVNTGDDFEHLGLHISPDIDSVLYGLAQLNDTDRGWGLAAETWSMMEAMANLGGETWFQLGDRDLATHLFRTQALSRGETLSQACRQLGLALGVEHLVMPMSDQPVGTVVLTDEGPMEFQHYFVRRQCQPAVSGIEFSGIDRASPNPEVMSMLEDPALRAVIICPSNPFVSVDPILGLPGLRNALKKTSAKIIAVSPIVGGAAIKGPAAKMLAELGLEVSAASVCRHYEDFLDSFVIDELDVTLKHSLEELGLEVAVTNTMMTTLDDKKRLARFVLDLIKGSP